MIFWGQLYRQGLRSALCDLAFLADNLRRDVLAGHGFGTNYDIPVVILCEQDSKPEWFRIGWLFWNSVATEPICNAGIVVEKCSVSV